MTTPTYSPRADISAGERPCGEKLGTHAGAERHRRAVRKLEAEGLPIPRGVHLDDCGPCLAGERVHQRELYEARKTKRAKDRTPRP